MDEYATIILVNILILSNFVFFIKKSESKFVVIIVYDDNVNIIETHEYLKKEFEMKGFGKQSFILAYRSSIEILK